MSTFVLVPGFWLGGWAWRDVTETLRAAGHSVFPVTLTGLKVATQGDGWRLPLPPWEELDQGNDLAGLGESERRTMRERAVDQPFGTARQPMRPRNPASVGLPRTAIWCSLTILEVEQMIATYPTLTSTLTEPGWQFIEFPTGHWPMFSRPRELALLLEAR